MNAPHNFKGAPNNSASVPTVAGPVSPSGPAATYSGRSFVRVAGERFDGDQITPPCESCGLDEYGCECEVESWPAGPVMSMDEARRQIAKAFNPTGWELAEKAALRARASVTGEGGLHE